MTQPPSPSSSGSINDIQKANSKTEAPIKKKKQHDYGIDWLCEPYSTVRGETSLWVAVISQAIVDGLSNSRNPEAQYHKHEAIRWLTGGSKDFTLVCYFADMDPDYVRRKAKKALIAPTPWRAEAGKGKRYLERKTYRERNKKNIEKKSEPVFSEEKIIVGPWQ